MRTEPARASRAARAAYAVRPAPPARPSTASCVTLPVHRFSHALNAVELNVRIPILKDTVWSLITPWAPHRGSRLATLPRTGQNFRCRAFAVEFDQTPRRPPSCSSPKLAPGLQDVLATEMLILPISSG